MRMGFCFAPDVLPSPLSKTLLRYVAYLPNLEPRPKSRYRADNIRILVDGSVSFINNHSQPRVLRR